MASGVTFINHDITCMMFNYMDKKHNYRLRQGSIVIGNNVIIGAGSLVNKNIPDGVIAVGVPCKVIGSFDEYQRKMVKEESK